MQVLKEFSRILIVERRQPVFNFKEIIQKINQYSLGLFSISSPTIFWKVEGGSQSIDVLEPHQNGEVPFVS